jgi:acetyl/propionyl-CoA carboxylase alpha subunit
MEIMGDKLSAKQAVKAYNIPLVPGTDEAISDVPPPADCAGSGLSHSHQGLGGGGGKGMRIVNHAPSFEEQMQLAINEPYRPSATAPCLSRSS